MVNFVRLSGMLARRFDDYFVLDCNGVFVRCIDYDTAKFNITDCFVITGHLLNQYRRNVNTLIVSVDALKLVT